MFLHYGKLESLEQMAKPWPLASGNVIPSSSSASISQCSLMDVVSPTFLCLLTPMTTLWKDPQSLQTVTESSTESVTATYLHISWRNSPAADYSSYALPPPTPTPYSHAMAPHCSSKATSANVFLWGLWHIGTNLNMELNGRIFFPVILFSINLFSLSCFSLP